MIENPVYQSNFRGLSVEEAREYLNDIEQNHPDGEVEIELVVNLPCTGEALDRLDQWAGRETAVKIWKNRHVTYD